MQIVLSIGEAVFLFLGITALQFLLGLWIKSRLEASIKSEYDRLLEDYRFDLKAREQAAKVAEYMALAWKLRHDSSEIDYRRANQLAWELTLWLPDDIYRKMGQALSSSPSQVLSVLIEVRKLILHVPGSLSDADVIFHEPNVGRRVQP